MITEELANSQCAPVQHSEVRDGSVMTKEQYTELLELLNKFREFFCNDPNGNGLHGNKHCWDIIEHACPNEAVLDKYWRSSDNMKNHQKLQRSGSGHRNKLWLCQSCLAGKQEWRKTTDDRLLEAECTNYEKKYLCDQTLTCLKDMLEQPFVQHQILPVDNLQVSNTGS